MAAIVSDPEILGGAPCFKGTRVPLDNLMEYLEGGDSIEVFLEQFPSVTRPQVTAAIDEMKEALVLKVGGLANGLLLGRAQDQFDVFITADRNLQYQNVIAKF